MPASVESKQSYDSFDDSLIIEGCDMRPDTVSLHGRIGFKCLRQTCRDIVLETIPNPADMPFIVMDLKKQCPNLSGADHT